MVPYFYFFEEKRLTIWYHIEYNKSNLRKENKNTALTEGGCHLQLWMISGGTSTLTLPREKYIIFEM